MIDIFPKLEGRVRDIVTLSGNTVIYISDSNPNCNEICPGFYLSNWEGLDVGQYVRIRFLPLFSRRFNTQMGYKKALTVEKI